MSKIISNHYLDDYRNHKTTANLATISSLTRQFHVDRAPLCLPSLARQHEYGALGKPSGWIPLRELSATDQLQNTIRCDSHVLSAAERPTAVNKWSYLHVDQLLNDFIALYQMNNFDLHVLAANK